MQCISIGSVIFAGLMIVTDQTDDTTLSVTIASRYL